MRPVTDVLRAVRAARVAVVAWHDPALAPTPQVRGVVPLVGDDGPVLALPYAVADAARSLGAAPEVLLALVDPTRAGAGWEPLLLRCRPRLEEDREGDRFCEELLTQELLRHPPTRLLADSVMLRREHWWWLPRLLVELDVVASGPLAGGEGGADHLLVVAGGTAGGPGGPEDPALTAAAVRVDAADPAVPTVALPDDATLPAGPATLFGQEATTDFERWGQWAWQGGWDGHGLAVDVVPEHVGLPPVPGVVARWRRQRALERACRDGIAAAGG